MVHHSVPDEKKKAGKAKEGKTSSKSSSSKTDQSVNLLLPARQNDSAKVYKQATSSDDNASSLKIAAQLEQSVLDDITAVNERNWSPDGPLFKNKASYWEADLPSSAGAAGKITNAQFVATIQRVCIAHPEYRVKVNDFNTSVDERNGRAEVYCNVETSGFFTGVTQRNVTLCEYHLIDGEWYHVSHRTMQGMDSQRMPFMG